MAWGSQKDIPGFGGGGCGCGKISGSVRDGGDDVEQMAVDSAPVGARWDGARPTWPSPLGKIKSQTLTFPFRIAEDPPDR